MASGTASDHEHARVHKQWEREGDWGGAGMIIKKPLRRGDTAAL